MAPETAPRSAPLALWRGARTFLESLFLAFGGPADIAAQHAFAAHSYALIRAWLRAGESILRQLLLIEAAALAPAGAPPLPVTRKAARQTARTQSAPRIGNPETWRVSFRCFGDGAWDDKGCWAPPPRRQALRRARHGAPATLHPAFPLAARCEAMLRVFNDPAPYAQRLLKRLLRRPRRAADLLREPPPSPHGPRACADIPELMPAAWKAWAALDTC